MRCICWFAAFVLFFVAGCGTSAPTASGTVAKAKPSATMPEPQPPKFAPKADPNATPPAAPPPPKPVEMVREVARPGVSGKGDYDPGIVTTPLTSYFSLKEQLVFDASIPKAIQIFEAARNRKLASHQEFMTEIIGKSNIRLPKLPPDHRYVYDPELGQLMVERPKTAD